MTNQEAIDYIMDHFDFAVARQTMICMRWRWGDAEDAPEESELRQNARRLLNIVKDKPEGHFAASGRLRAEKYGEGIFRLSFEVTDWDTFE